MRSRGKRSMPAGTGVCVVNTVEADHLDIYRDLDDIRGAFAEFARRARFVVANADDREAKRSGLEDTDITTTVVELQKTMTILSATQASFTKLSALSLFDYLR